MSLPRVYTAISAVTEAMSGTGVRKRKTNSKGGYRYRGIDDVVNQLSPLLAANRLCMLPRVLERTAVDRRDRQGGTFSHVCLKVAFDLISADDGSSHSIDIYAEALDGSDKATSKALSAAYKYAALQAFCIPVSDIEEPDELTPPLGEAEIAEPVQGWDQWHRDILDMVSVCESVEALDRVQDTYRALLRRIAAERPELYNALGQAVTGRRKVVRTPVNRLKKTQAESSAGTTESEATHA